MGKKLTTEIFIERAKKVHGDRYDYSKAVYKSYHENIAIVCPEHGVFYQCVRDHLSGHGCPVCAGNKKVGLVDFVKRAKKIHGDKYDYSKVKYINNKTKVLIHCNECGYDFYQRPDKHLRGQGCPECAVNNKLTRDKFIKKAREIHGDRYDYSKVKYVNNRTKVCIIDPYYGEFWQIPNSHLLGKGSWAARADRCFNTKKRNGTFNSSIIQDKMHDFLLEKFSEDDVFFEYKEDERYPYHCDFYIKSLDLFIEINGHWTHNNHWFDENNPDDIAQLNEWIKRDESFEYGCYGSAIHVWTNRDVKKRETARRNNLNYVVFWGNCEKDIVSWFEEGCPIRKDWK